MNRISPGTMTIVIFALLIGLGGAYVVRQQMNKPGLPPLELASQSTKNIIVPIAGDDLEAGRVVTFNDIVVRSFTPEAYAKSEFAGKPFMPNTTQIIGRTLKEDTVKGGFFSPTDFYPDGFGPSVADRLQAGFRAVTVPIEDIGAVQGFASAGSIVDVLFRSEKTADRVAMTITLLEEVEVLAMDRTLLPGQSVETTGTVTLAVTPAQAKSLKVVEGNGMISLALRNPNEIPEFDLAPVQFDPNRVDFIQDNVQLLTTTNLNSDSGRSAGVSGSMGRVLENSSEHVTLDDLLGNRKAKVKKTITIYRGGQRVVEEFEEKANDDELLINSGRVRTPIAGRRPQQSQKVENASVEYLP